MLKAQDVAFQYDDDAPYVIDGVSMEIEKGQFIAILGANGCGKSTLAKHFNAILLPDKGTVWVEAIPTTDEDKLMDIRQKVGMVFQNPDNQIVTTIVEEDVAFALENLGVPTEQMRVEVDEAMHLTDIYEFRHRAPHQLSGGQKQRVAIAGIIAMQPDCLVLDEATAMLDPKGRDKVMRTIHKLNKEKNLTVVHITHYMEEVINADKIFVMDAGKVVFSGTPKDIFSRVEEMRALHLDIPQSAELCYELTKAGIEMPRGVIEEEECARLIYEKITHESNINLGEK